MAKKGLLDIVKSIGGGAINRTINRLKGAGIGGYSKIPNARAKWVGRQSKKDWRVRLEVPTESPVWDELFTNNELLSKLKESNGIFWPLTPSMIIQHSANYNPLAQTHANYPFQAYQNSQVDQMNIIGEFPVQNYDDAQHWVATIKFLRTVTKMFFGKSTKTLKGNPPPVLHLYGYGENMFHKVPVVVNSFNVELRSGIDYISTTQEPTYGYDSVIDRANFNYANEDATWAPTLSNISVLITPVYSRETVKNFSFKDFANGTLSKKQGIGYL